MKNSIKKISSNTSRNIFALLLTTSLLAACSSNNTISVNGDSTDDAQTDESVTDGGVDLGSSDSDGQAGTTEGDSSGSADAGGADTDSADAGNSDGEVTDGGTDIPPEPTPVDLTPVVRAPVDEQISLSDSLELVGSVTYDAMFQDAPVIEWAKLSGPGSVMFIDSNSATTSVSFDQAGSYSLELKASNGLYEAADQVSVVVVADVVNQAPSVNAGADKALNIDAVLNLSAVIDDDGLPTNTLGGSWSKTSGAGSVTFGEATAAVTTASFSATGNYTLQFTVSDGELSSDDELSVTITDSSLTDAGNNIDAATNWETVVTSDGSLAQARHEAGAIAYQDKFYLLGGRGLRQTNRYSPGPNSWDNLGLTDFVFNHFQPVIYDEKIYVVGAIDCCFPNETMVDVIKIYDPASNAWSDGSDIPANRLRGSAGVVLYNNKIYIAAGTTNGHDGGAVNWFDEYNPANDTWTTLPDAPTRRDHFSAALVGTKLVLAGGRQTDVPNFYEDLVSDVDIYDFATGQWTSGANIPTPRAGAMTVSHGDEVILIGGEIETGTDAVTVVEAYNVKTNTWRTLDSLNTARHSGGAAIVNGEIHVVSGNLYTGGGAETQAHEKISLD